MGARQGASGSVERIAWLGKIAALPGDLLTDAEVEEIDRVSGIM